jgi:hypothetical protein
MTSFWITENNNCERPCMITWALSGVVAIMDQSWEVATLEECRERLGLKHQ